LYSLVDFIGVAIFPGGGDSVANRISIDGLFLSRASALIISSREISPAICCLSAPLCECVAFAA
jgi:hypothetical protein